MEAQHSLPDPPAEPFRASPGASPTKNQNSSGAGGKINHHEGNNTGAYLTFQHALIRVMKGVGCPNSIATIADFRPDQWVNMKAPGGRRSAPRIREISSTSSGAPKRR